MKVEVGDWLEWPDGHLSKVYAVRPITDIDGQYYPDAFAHQNFDPTECGNDFCIDGDGGAGVYSPKNARVLTFEETPISKWCVFCDEETLQRIG